jgi:chaperonin GroES
MDEESMAENLMRPVGNKVLVKAIPPPDKTASGLLLLPQTAEPSEFWATVVAVGPGQRLANGEFAGIDLKPGDKVMYEGYKAFGVKLRGEDYLMLYEGNIILAIEED